MYSHLCCRHYEVEPKCVNAMCCCLCIVKWLLTLAIQHDKLQQLCVHISVHIWRSTDTHTCNAYTFIRKFVTRSTVKHGWNQRRGLFHFTCIWFAVGYCIQLYCEYIVQWVLWIYIFMMQRFCMFSICRLCNSCRISVRTVQLSAIRSDSVDRNIALL